MVSVAQIGYGHWGRNLARNFGRLGYLTAVSDTDRQTAVDAAAVHDVPARSLDEILADPAINGVSIASPAELHYAQAKAALEAGKHVFVEKPLALKVGEAEELCRLAKQQGLALMVGHLMQYHPHYVKLRSLVRAGELGDLRYVYSNRMSLGKFRREENVLWSFAPHDISMILSLFEAEPASVTAQGNVAYTPGVADVVTMQMHFPGGGSGHIQVSWMHPFKEQRLVVIGDAAMAVFEDSEENWDSKLKLYRHSIEAGGAVPMPVKAEAQPVLVDHAEPLETECRQFARSIETGATPPTDGAEGLRVLRVLDQAERALSENLRLQQQAGEGVRKA